MRLVYVASNLEENQLVVSLTATGQLQFEDSVAIVIPAGQVGTIFTQLAANKAVYEGDYTCLTEVAVTLDDQNDKYSAATVPAWLGGFYVDGGTGNDDISGSLSNDTLRGGWGNDTIHAGDGNDRCDGGRDNDHIGGGEGHDELAGDTGSDEVLGDDGNDVLFGAYNDINRYVTGIGNPSWYNGDTPYDNGNDTLFGGTGDDALYGGNVFTSTEDGFTEITAIGDGHDTLSGDEGQDEVYGGSGNNLLNGGDDPDIITALNGNDFILGGNEDIFVYQMTGDDIDAGQGDDIVWAARGDDVVALGGGSDSADGGDGNDTIAADPNVIDQINLVRGEPDTHLDSIESGAGDDVITAWFDRDTILTSDGNDTVTYGHAEPFNGEGTMSGTLDQNAVISTGSGSDMIIIYSSFALARYSVDAGIDNDFISARGVGWRLQVDCGYGSDFLDAKLANFQPYYAIYSAGLDSGFDSDVIVGTSLQDHPEHFYVKAADTLGGYEPQWDLLTLI